MNDKKDKPKSNKDLGSNMNRKSEKPKTEEQQECPPKDFQRIVHELQVYQIELQMQNEELRNARQEIQEVLNKYTELYDFAPVSYFTLDKNSLIVEANLAGARMLNLQRGQLIGRRFDLLVSPDFRQEFNSYCKTLFEVDTIQICSEVKIAADDKAIIYAQIEGIALQNRDLIQIALMNITERKLAKEALIKAYDELDDIVKVRTETLFNLNGDLKMQSQSLEEVNTALNVLLKQREQDKKEQEDRILSNVRELIVPCIEQLKKSGLSPKYESCLGVLESNLLEIISPFSITLSSKYAGLTHTEIRVADFIREGKSTKEIAEILNISKDTVDAHRKNIRKKLDLKGMKTNLRSHLLSIK